jgi:hypothetical protein
MHLIKTALLSAIMIIPTICFCQQEPMPEKISPEALKLIREQEQRIKDSIEESKKNPRSKFGMFQCRADAQNWTTDPLDSKDARSLSVNTGILVNGQFRSVPPITRHVTVSVLQQRVYEMTVCEREDAEFEKQFGTYSAMSKAYSEEVCFRYMYFLTTHKLDEQFIKEDAEANK